MRGDAVGGGRGVAQRSLRGFRAFGSGLILGGDGCSIYTGAFWRLGGQRVPGGFGNR